MQISLSFDGAKQEPPRLPPQWTRRKYQIDAVDNVFRDLQAQRSTLVVLATGLGKTRVAGAGVIARWLRERRGPVLWLAHLDTLIEQTRRELQAQLGESIGHEQGPNYWASERVCVASLATLYQERRIEKVRRRPTLLVYDEAHHSMSAANKKLLDAMPQAKLLGLTATPARFDGVGLKGLFESVSAEVDINDGREDGYLVPVEWEVAEIAGMDFSKLTKQEFESDEAKAKIIGKDSVLHGIVKATLDKVGERKTIMFFPTIAVANLAAGVFNELRPGCAIAVDSKLDRDEKRNRIAAFKRGDFQVLCNVAIVTEGFDCPEVAAVGMAAPTNSVSRYLQQLGRGTRNVCRVDDYETAEERRAAIAASVKPNLLCIDFVGNSGKHSPVLALDVLAGKDADPEVVKRAKKEAKAGRVSSEEAMHKGRAALARERAEEAAKVAKGEAVEFKFRKHDPFSAFGVKHDVGFEATKNALNRPSIEQVRRLQQHGMEATAEMSGSEAQRLIRVAEFRRAKGLSTYKQINLLGGVGVKANGMYKSTASAIIKHMIEQAKITGRRNLVHPGREELLRITKECQRTPGCDDL